MDIEDGLTLNADTGAIALLEKSVQIRENYPEVDSDDSNPTKATSSKNRATPYTKPTIVRKTPLARQEEYIVIRKASEVSLARLSSELKSLTEGQPGRRTKEKSQKIDDLKKQIDLHKQQIAQADEAIVKLRSTNIELQQVNINTSLQAQFEKQQLIAQAHTQIAAIQTDKTSIENQAISLVATSQQLENRLHQKDSEIETLNREKADIIENCSKQFSLANESIANLRKQIDTFTNDKTHTENLLKNQHSIQQTLEGQVKTLSAELSEYIGKYNNLSLQYQQELQKLKQVISQSDEELQAINKAHSDQIVILENEKLHLSTQLQTLQQSATSTTVDQSQRISNLTLELKNINDKIIQERNTHNNQVKEIKDHFTNLIDQKDSQIGQLQFSLSESLATCQTHVEEADKLRDTIKQLNITLSTLNQPVNNPPSVIQYTSSRMASASDLSELVSIPLREKIPYFSGYLGDISVVEWFKKAERIAKGGNWTKEQMKRYFAERFCKLALSFQEELDDPSNPNPTTSYEEWKKLIIEEFRDPSENQYFKNELSEIKQKTNERVRDYKARLEKLFIQGYSEKMFRSSNNDMKIVRDDILKNAFENGLKAELLQGYENRIPADATYEVAVTTATDIENIQARKKSLSSKNRQSELSAISLHQELLTSDVEELKRKFEGLNFSNNSQVRSKNKDISSVSSTPFNSERPYTGTPNFSVNSKAVKFSNSSVANDRSRPALKRPRPGNERSPSPYVNRSPSPYNRNRSPSPFSRENKYNNRSTSPYPRERSNSRDRSTPTSRERSTSRDRFDNRSQYNNQSYYPNNARSVTPTRNNRIFVRSNFPYRTPFIKPTSPTTPYNNSSFRNSNITQPLRCHHCNRVGHIRPQCPRLSSLGRNNSN